MKAPRARGATDSTDPADAGGAKGGGRPWLRSRWGPVAGAGRGRRGRVGTGGCRRCLQGGGGRRCPRGRFFGRAPPGASPGWRRAACEQATGSPDAGPRGDAPGPCLSNAIHRRRAVHPQVEGRLSPPNPSISPGIDSCPQLVNKERHALPRMDSAVAACTTGPGAPLGEGGRPPARPVPASGPARPHGGGPSDDAPARRFPAAPAVATGGDRGPAARAVPAGPAPRIRRSPGGRTQPAPGRAHRPLAPPLRSRGRPGGDEPVVLRAPPSSPPGRPVRPWRRTIAPASPSGPAPTPAPVRPRPPPSRNARRRPSGQRPPRRPSGRRPPWRWPGEAAPMAPAGGAHSRGRIGT